ncbi:MAG: ABC transporter ATP-binding protein, partial [Nitrospinae bacterium]|nr:ABC transporter ATP-binding protein [Nitrospinota bacterium]
MLCREASNPQSTTARRRQRKSLKKYFPVYGGLLSKVVGQVKAVDDVSFNIQEGEILGLVGESGCGKTTVGRISLRLMPPPSGSVYFEEPNIFKLNRKNLDLLRP